MPETQTTINPDTAQLMRDLEQGLKEAQTGVYAQVHTPDDIARRKRARPAGSVKAVLKEPVKLRREVLAALRSSDPG